MNIRLGFDFFFCCCFFVLNLLQCILVVMVVCYHRMYRNLQNDCYSCYIGCILLNTEKKHSFIMLLSWKWLLNENTNSLGYPQILRGIMDMHTQVTDLSALPHLQLQTWQCVTSRKKHGCTANLSSLSLFYLIQLSVSSLNSFCPCLCTAVSFSVNFLWFHYSKRLVRRFIGTAAVIKCSIWWWFFFYLFGLQHCHTRLV